MSPGEQNKKKLVHDIRIADVEVMFKRRNAHVSVDLCCPG